MTLDYSFFESTLAETRTYRLKYAGYCEFVESESIRPRIEILDDSSEDYLDVCVRHLMNTTGSNTKTITDALGVCVPQDISEFYRKWDGGVLFFRDYYPIMPVAEVLSFAQELRALRNESDNLPWDILRFCDMRDGNYIALRKNPRNDWEIIFAPAEKYDQDLMEMDTPELLLDSSFWHWLQRMIETDGYPLSKEGKTWMDNDEPYADRLS